MSDDIGRFSFLKIDTQVRMLNAEVRPGDSHLAITLLDGVESVSFSSKCLPERRVVASKRNPATLLISKPETVDSINDSR